MCCDTLFPTAAYRDAHFYATSQTWYAKHRAEMEQLRRQQTRVPAVAGGGAVTPDVASEVVRLVHETERLSALTVTMARVLECIIGPRNDNDDIANEQQLVRGICCICGKRVLNKTLCKNKICRQTKRINNFRTALDQMRTCVYC